jgi:hypothetical protein
MQNFLCLEADPAIIVATEDEAVRSANADQLDRDPLLKLSINLFIAFISSSRC